MPLLTTAIAKSDYLRESGDAHDAVIARQIARIEERVATWVGFGRFAGAAKPSLEQASYTIYTHARPDRSDRGAWGAGVAVHDWSPTYGQAPQLRVQGARRLLLPLFPIASITSIHQDEDWLFGDDTEVSSDDYTLFTDTWALTKNPSTVAWSTTHRAIKIVLVAGFDPDAPPDLLVDAIGKQLVHERKNADALGKTSLSSDGATVQFRSMRLLPSVLEQLGAFKLPEVT